MLKPGDNVFAISYGHHSLPKVTHLLQLHLQASPTSHVHSSDVYFIISANKTEPGSNCIRSQVQYEGEISLTKTSPISRAHQWCAFFRQVSAVFPWYTESASCRRRSSLIHPRVQCISTQLLPRSWMEKVKHKSQRRRSSLPWAASDGVALK